MKYHFIYKTISATGKYYIGRHTTTNTNDGYLGSGKWVRSIKDKSLLTRIILEFCETFDDLLIRERFYLDEHIDLPECMNFNNQPCGFANGDLNPAKSVEQRARCSKRLKSNNPNTNPTSVEKRVAKIRGVPSKTKGIKRSEETKHNISVARTGIKISDEGRAKLSQSRKMQYEAGERSLPSFLGLSHSAETKCTLSILALQRVKQICPYCKKLIDKGNFVRWHGDRCKQK